MIEAGQEQILQIENLISDFIWAGRPAKVKKTALISQYEEGGLKAPDIKTIIKAQRIVWLKRYFESEFHPWKAVFDWQ